MIILKLSYISVKMSIQLPISYTEFVVIRDFLEKKNSITSEQAMKIFEDQLIKFKLVDFE